MAVTIIDVANETNLAISTISKYINGQTVRPKNQKLIEEAIKKLGYIPNSNARGLRGSKSYTIGLIISFLNDHHAAQITNTIEQKMKTLGYSVLLSFHRDEERAAMDAIKFMTDRMVDGIILIMFPNYTDLFGNILDTLNTPIVIIEQSYGSQKRDCVSVDGVSGTYNAIEYLITRGHERIAIITGDLSIITAKERLRGYYRAFEDYYLEIDPTIILEGDYKFGSGYELMLQLWDLEKKPTAIFVSNYKMCLGVMMAIQKLNIKLPDELAVITFDDMELSIVVKPNLTSIRQPIDEMMDEACALLLKRIQGDFSCFPKRIRLKTELIERESVMKRN